MKHVHLAVSASFDRFVHTRVITILSPCNAREKILSHQRMQLTHYTTIYLALVVR